MIPGRDKPHIKKVRGYWCVYMAVNVAYHLRHAAYLYVEERNQLIRSDKEKSHEQRK